MIVLGLTGSIGMGKSTAAAMFRRMGIPVHDADATVHQLMAPGGLAVSDIAAVFPAMVTDGVVDRRQLGTLVFGDPVALRKLERILHPRVQADSRRFCRLARRRRNRVVVLDIPLLFESGATDRVDKIIVVTAPAFLQRQRVLKRPQMTEEKFRNILKRQVPDSEKRARADYIVPSGLGRAVTWRMLRHVLRDVLRPS